MSTQSLSHSHNIDEALANRRGAFRHHLPAPLRVGAEEGFVRDLSTRGLYFVAPTAPRVGSIVELDIALPHASPAGPLNCRVAARVLRVESLGESHGVAAEIEGWKMPATNDLDG